MWDDNNVFLNERQLNSGNFFRFFKSIVEMEKPGDLIEAGKTELLDYLEGITTQMVFELLVYSHENETIKEIGSILRSIIAANDAAAQRFA